MPLLSHHYATPVPPLCHSCPTIMPLLSQLRHSYVLPSSLLHTHHSYVPPSSRMFPTFATHVSHSHRYYRVSAIFVGGKLLYNDPDFFATYDMISWGLVSRIVPKQGLPPLNVYAPLLNPLRLPPFLPSCMSYTYTSAIAVLPPAPATAARCHYILPTLPTTPPPPTSTPYPFRSLNPV
jgi:hypothetical protein